MSFICQFDMLFSRFSQFSNSLKKSNGISSGPLAVLRFAFFRYCRTSDSLILLVSKLRFSLMIFRNINQCFYTCKICVIFGRNSQGWISFCLQKWRASRGMWGEAPSMNSKTGLLMELVTKNLSRSIRASMWSSLVTNPLGETDICHSPVNYMS
mgnify:CR=1 FL=1